MVLTIRVIGPMDQVVLNGVHEGLIYPSNLPMIIRNEDHIHPIILITLLHMEVILNIWVQEVALDLVGSKGHLLACRGCLRMVVVMITTVDKDLMPQYLPNIQLLFLLMFLALLLTLQWPHPRLKQITIMDSHMVQIMGIQHLIPRLHLLSIAMGMGTKNQNMIIMLQHSIPMEGMGLLSHIHKLELSQVMVHSSIMASLNHMAWHHRGQLPSLMALLGLVNQETQLIRVLHQLNHMVRMFQPNSHIRMHLVCLHSRPILHMVLPQLMGIINHRLSLAQDIHSKEDNRLVMASLERSRHPAMHKWLLLQVTHNTHLLNKVTLSSLCQTQQVMGTKGLKTPYMEVSLHQPMVPQQLRSQVMPNQQPNKVTISQSHSLLVMELRQLLQLVMGKQFHLSLVILSMTRVKCMLLHRAEYTNLVFFSSESFML